MQGLQTFHFFLIGPNNSCDGLYQFLILLEVYELHFSALLVMIHIVALCFRHSDVYEMTSNWYYLHFSDELWGQAYFYVFSGQCVPLKTRYLLPHGLAKVETPCRSCFLMLQLLNWSFLWHLCLVKTRTLEKLGILSFGSI